MSIKNSIAELWKQGYFETHRAVKEINYILLKDFGVTCSNTTMLLKSCNNFLRKDTKGWIQKNRYSNFKNTKNTEKDYFKILKIHPEIEIVSKKLFLDKHYSQAIFEAFKKLNNLVKEKSECNDLDGKGLMLTVFSVNNPILKINGLVSQSDKDEQEGFMHLYAGAIMGIRNPKGHENMIQKDINRTLKYLMFASLLCERLEECSKNDS